MTATSILGSPRTKSIAEAAAILGCSPYTLYDRRQGLVVDMGEGRELQLIRIGRYLRVPDVELARFLGEAPPLPTAG